MILITWNPEAAKRSLCSASVRSRPPVFTIIAKSIAIAACDMLEFSTDSGGPAALGASYF
jgi:hypothetical protein